MNYKYRNILIAIVFVLVFLIGYVLGCVHKIKNNEQQNETLTDTITDTILDTIEIKVPIPKNIYIIDSVPFPDSVKEIDTFYLPRVQKEYRDSLWNIWISGVEPLSLDSINLFVSKEKEIIRNKEVVNIVDKKPHFYGGVGFYSFCDNISTGAVVSMQLNNKWLLGANLGVCDNKLTYGLSVQYKIF